MKRLFDKEYYERDIGLKPLIAFGALWIFTALIAIDHPLAFLFYEVFVASFVLMHWKTVNLSLQGKRVDIGVFKNILWHPMHIRRCILAGR